MTNYNDGNWHGWNGGECPVHPKTVVEYATIDCATMERQADDLSWSKINCHPIIAFRVVNQFKEPREFWLCGGKSFDDKDNAYIYRSSSILEIIHVREVCDE